MQTWCSPKPSPSPSYPHGCCARPSAARPAFTPSRPASPKRSPCAPTTPRRPVKAPPAPPRRRPEAPPAPKGGGARGRRGAGARLPDVHALLGRQEERLAGLDVEGLVPPALVAHGGGAVGAGRVAVGQQEAAQQRLAVLAAPGLGEAH